MYYGVLILTLSLFIEERLREKSLPSSEERKNKRKIIARNRKSKVYNKTWRQK